MPVMSFTGMAITFALGRVGQKIEYPQKAKTKRKLSMRVKKHHWHISDRIQSTKPTNQNRPFKNIQGNIYIRIQAPEGTPCAFPFEFEGTIHHECTDEGWDTPWCSTDHVFNDHWGECACLPTDKKRVCKACLPAWGSIGDENGECVRASC